ncbi:MAG: hypothetical protein Q4G63_10055 [Bacteroidia bacterium]|nr:hypothetical protein [Bacteroidia bacterium]
MTDITEKVSELMQGKKAHRQTQIVEIQTEEHTRRGLLRGYFSEDDVIVFSWIPELAKDVKNIDHVNFDLITVLCEYRPEEVISIKKV